jgi:hypothetical protein
LEGLEAEFLAPFAMIDGKALIRNRAAEIDNAAAAETS